MVRTRRACLQKRLSPARRLEGNRVDLDLVVLGLVTELEDLIVILLVIVVAVSHEHDGATQRQPVLFLVLLVYSDMANLLPGGLERLGG